MYYMYYNYITTYIICITIIGYGRYEISVCVLFFLRNMHFYSNYFNFNSFLMMQILTAYFLIYNALYFKDVCKWL